MITSFFLKKSIWRLLKKGWLEVDIETKLARSGFEIMHDVIGKEYKFILEQQTKIETLEREKNFYKSMYEIYNKDMDEKINKLLKPIE
jgi:hypothetical protein